MGIVKPNEAVRGDESGVGVWKAPEEESKLDSHTKGLKKERARVSRA